MTEPLDLDAIERMVAALHPMPADISEFCYALVAKLRAARERAATMEAALRDALEAAEQDGLHGGDSHDDDCPVCGLIANSRAALAGGRQT